LLKNFFSLRIFREINSREPIKLMNFKIEIIFVKLSEYPILIGIKSFLPIS